MALTTFTYQLTAKAYYDKWANDTISKVEVLSPKTYSSISNPVSLLNLQSFFSINISTGSNDITTFSNWLNHEDRNMDVLAGLNAFSDEFDSCSLNLTNVASAFIANLQTNKGSIAFYDKCSVGDTINFQFMLNMTDDAGIVVADSNASILYTLTVTD